MFGNGITHHVLSKCGLIIHQTFNQRLPASIEELANLPKHNRDLGCHDIRIGNEPDQRMQKFIGHGLLAVLPEMRERFDHYFDLIEAYASGEMEYKEFAGRAKCRSQGVDEDGDKPWEQGEQGELVNVRSELLVKPMRPSAAIDRWSEIGHFDGPSLTLSPSRYLWDSQILTDLRFKRAPPQVTVRRQNCTRNAVDPA